MRRSIHLFLLLFPMACGLHVLAQDTLRTQVLVVGGGTGGTSAAITSARHGARTFLAEEGPWLGGMLSAAGVSATDGNDQLPSGIWEEFRQALYKAYKGKENLSTGWVSNTAFEPHVADSIFKAWAAREKTLTVRHHLRPQAAILKDQRLLGVRFLDLATKRTLTVLADQTIEATEQGDLLELAGVPYDLGMEAGTTTGEKVGIDATNDIVQDLTWVAILKDKGPGTDNTIARPPDYDPSEFDGSCKEYWHDQRIKAPTNSAQAMLDYGRLPNGKYLLNWPIRGNDTYLNVVRMAPEERERALRTAKATTLRFIYFIQHELGFRNLAPDSSEFPGGDGLALIPYYRESRRMRGVVRFRMPDVADPFGNGEPLYRTGIAVGDYPIDHHHKKNPAAPQHLDFYPVPSFSVPLGVMIPERMDGLIAADKNISVSNVVNGTTRLQPVVLLTGQAAGTLAALAIRTNKQPRQVNVRDIQQDLLQQKAFLLPYLDVPPDHPYFSSIQRVGATGLLQGTGVPHQWANQTWFRPDAIVDADSLFRNWNAWLALPMPKERTVTLENLVGPLSEAAKRKLTVSVMRKWLGRPKGPDEPLTRGELACLLDHALDIFKLAPVDLHGHFLPAAGRH